MNSILVRYLLLSVIFQASLMLGMEVVKYKYGTLCRDGKILNEVVNDAFELDNNQNAKRFFKGVFRMLEAKKNNVRTEAKNSSNAVNWLFYKGNLYINRFFPILQTYEGIKFEEKSYSSLQVADILGFSKQQIIALQRIKDYIPNMQRALQYGNMEKTWNFMISHPTQRKFLAQRSGTPKVAEYYRRLWYFIEAAETLKYNVSNETFTENTLIDIYAKAQQYCLEYAGKIADYVSFFNEDDGNKLKQELSIYQYNKEKTLLQQLQKPDILLNMQDICCKPEFKQYAHTEYMLKYQLFNKNLTASISSVSFVSYYDMCDNCESLWAGIANNNFPVKVVSYKEYSSSRSKEKKNGNPHLTLVYSSK